jgi:hypothetical protein
MTLYKGGEGFIFQQLSASDIYIYENQNLLEFLLHQLNIAYTWIAALIQKSTTIWLSDRKLWTYSSSAQDLQA